MKEGKKKGARYKAAERGAGSRGTAKSRGAGSKGAGSSRAVSGGAAGRRGAGGEQRSRKQRGSRGGGSREKSRKNRSSEWKMGIGQVYFLEMRWLRPQEAVSFNAPLLQEVCERKLE